MMDQHYGLLVGLCYTLPFAISGLFAGQLTRNLDRKVMLIAVITAMSLCQAGVSMTTSFALFAALRVVHGMLCSAINPISFSLVSDLFPVDGSKESNSRRTTANSILSIANYAG